MTDSNALTARNQNAADVVPDHPLTFCEEGTVGWDDADAANFYDLGTGANDGHLLLRVQLFKGKAPHIKAKPGVGQGHKLLCRVGLMPFRVPPIGTVVLVAIPGGDIQTNGNPVVFCTVEANPTVQFAADRCVMDFGPDTHVIVKGKSVSLQQSDSARFIGVGQPRAGGAPGIFLTDADGSGVSISAGTAQIFATDGASPPDAKSVVQLTGTQIASLQKTAFGTSCVVIAADVVTTMAGKKCQILAGQTVIASDAASAAAALPAATGPLGAVPSTSTFIGL